MQASGFHFFKNALSLIKKIILFGFHDDEKTSLRKNIYLK